MGDFANQDLADFAKDELGTFATLGASSLKVVAEFESMIGKLFSAWVGERIAGKNQGAKGAILGYGTAALAKRSVPTLAAIALGGWAYKKWRDRKRRAPSYPSDATPRIPASETSSPS